MLIRDMVNRYKRRTKDDQEAQRYEKRLAHINSLELHDSVKDAGEVWGYKFQGQFVGPVFPTKENAEAEIINFILNNPQYAGNKLKVFKMPQSQVKDEADKLESLKRQLAQAKRTGGDKEYEKELEEEIAKLQTKPDLTKDKPYDPTKPKNILKAKTLAKAQGKAGADSDYRGYKVKDQIIKGFMIYKSGKPNAFTAKNESGEQYEGTMEEIKAKIDAYWVKRDEDVMKQKVNDEDSIIVSPETGGYDISVFIKNKKVKTAWKSNKTLALQTARDLADFYRDDNGQSLNIVTKDARPKHPRWCIKDDKLFKLKSAVKKMKDSTQYTISWIEDGGKESVTLTSQELLKYEPNNPREAAKKYLAAKHSKGKLLNITGDSKMKDAVNHMGERSFQTYEAWKRACKQMNPSVQFEGNKDICQAKPGIGEWDGDKGILYNTKDSSAPKEFNELREWQNAAMDLGYRLENNQQRGMWVAYQGNSEVGTFVPTRGGRLYVKDSFRKSSFGTKSYTKGSADRKMKDADEDDLISFYRQQLENAIDSGDKAELKKWSNLIFKNIEFTNDNMEYRGQNYTAQELYKTLITERRIKRKSTLTEKERLDRVNNMYPLWEDPNGGVYAVVDSLPIKSNVKFNKDSLPAGKHNDTPDDQFDADELAKGIKVEMEHTDDPELAKAIAKDHLAEIKDYYTRLLKMEEEAK